MDALSFAAVLRRCVDQLPAFTPEALGEFFDQDARRFHQPKAADPIVFHPLGDESDAAILLRGTIFWPGDKRIVRGHPRILPTSDYTSNRFQTLQERLLAKAALSGDLVIEPKLYGATVRIYSSGSDLLCATDVAADGGNPLVGAGIENARSLGIDYAGQAARLIGSRYARVERLARLEYVPVFVLQLPELSPDGGVDSADMILVDVIDPDHTYVERTEKERIAEDFDLRVVSLKSRLSEPTGDSLALLRRLRALEHQSAGPGSAGFIVKGQIDDQSDLLFCKIEPGAERDRLRDLSEADFASVVEEITGQFGESLWTDDRIAEEAMLEYLGSRHRSARWRVNAYLRAWRDARRVAGL